MRWAWVWDLLVPVAAVALFGALALYQIHLPGLYYDEALDAVPAMHVVQHRPVDLVRDAGVWIDGYGYPLMAMDYVGPVNIYLLVAFFKWLGVNVFALRLMTVSAAALTIVLYYFWTRWLINRPVAAGTAFLLATSPSFIFWSRQGVHVTSVVTMLAGGSLLSLLAWRRSGRAPFLWLAALLLGLGLSAKILFLWFIVAVLALGTLWAGAAAVATLRRRVAGKDALTLTLSQGQRGSSARSYLVALWHVVYVLASALLTMVFFLAGAGPVILYNVLTRGTLEVMVRNLKVSSDGVNNLAFADNLNARWVALQALLDGGHFWFLGGWPKNSVAWPVFLGASGLVALLLLHPSARRYRAPALFVLGLLVLVLVQSTVTLSGLGPTHLFVLLPLPQLLVALAAFLFVNLGRHLSRSWPRWPRRVTLGSAGLLAVGMVAGLGVADLQVDLAYHRLLTRTGGYLSHSDAIYRLADYLDRQPGIEPVALDWGISTSVQFLTQGRVKPREIFLYAKDPPPLFADLLYQYLIKEESRYIFRSDDVTVYPRRVQFQYWVGKLGKKEVLEQTIAQRDGKVLYFVYRVDNPD